MQDSHQVVIPSPLCNIHNTENCSLVCASTDCSTKGFICPICQYQAHQDHNVRPYRLLIKQLYIDRQQSQQYIQGIAFIDMKMNKIINMCSKQIPQQGDLRKMVFDAAKNYFEKVRKMIRGQFYERYSQLVYNCQKKSRNSSKVEQITVHTQEIKELEKILIQFAEQTSMINQNIDVTKVQCSAQKKASAFYRKLLYLKDQICNKQEIISESIKKKQCDLSLIQLFLTVNVSKKFLFSQKLKHASINIQDSGKKAKLNSYYDTVLCLVQPQLKANKKHTIKFKITYLPSWVAVGICILNVVKNNNYTFPSENHGTFQISYDGYSWVHKNSSTNEQYTSWYFNSNDIITVQYDPKLKNLTFTKNSDANKYILSTQNINKEDKIYFCVSLNSDNEAIEILQD